jgi:hypothetical protein
MLEHLQICKLRCKIFLGVARITFNGLWLKEVKWQTLNARDRRHILQDR